MQAGTNSNAEWRCFRYTNSLCGLCPLAERRLSAWGCRAGRDTACRHPSAVALCRHPLRRGAAGEPGPAGHVQGGAEARGYRWGVVLCPARAHTAPVTAVTRHSLPPGPLGALCVCVLGLAPRPDMQHPLQKLLLSPFWPVPIGRALLAQSAARSETASKVVHVRTAAALSAQTPRLHSSNTTCRNLMRYLFAPLLLQCWAT